MLKRSFLLLMVVASAYLTGCAATVPMASLDEDFAKKKFAKPSKGNAAVYIYRNSNLGFALKKGVYIDGVMLGETAAMTYFYKEIKPGKHTISTESEFGNNDLVLKAVKGKNYFVNQYIKMGFFVGGANLELVSTETGKSGVRQCKLAKEVGNGTGIVSQK